MAVTISSKNQITIPHEVRERLRLKPGDKVEIVVHEKSMTVFPKPKRWEKAIRGIAKGLYPADYLKKERRSWN